MRGRQARASVVRATPGSIVDGRLFRGGLGLEPEMMKRETRYAKSDGVSVAYQVVGDGPHDLILVPGFVSHVEVAWEQPRLAHFLSRLASFSRLIVFDKRGSGMSDPVDSPPSMDQRMDDIRAVMDAADSRRGTLFGISEGGTLSMLFAYKHPERARALVLYGSWARRLPGPDYPYGPSAEQLEDTIVGMDRAWASGTWWDGGRPSPADDAQHRAWWARAREWSITTLSTLRTGGRVTPMCTSLARTLSASARAFIWKTEM